MPQNLRKVIPPNVPNVWNLVLDIDPQILAQISAGDQVLFQFRAPNGNTTIPRQMTGSDLMNLLAPPPPPPNAGP